jgi:hypothetical protein
MIVFLFVLSWVLVLVAATLLFLIVADSRVPNFHAIWDKAVQGDKLCAAYVIAIGMAFGTAVLALLLKLLGV